MKRVGDVVVARPGYEAALSAVLGPLVDAWAAPDAASALTAVRSAQNQVTILFPEAGAAVQKGSLFEHVNCDRGFEDLGRRLLGGLVLGREVSTEGILQTPGLVRGGSDQLVRLTTRRRQVEEQMARLEPLAAEAGQLGHQAARKGTAASTPRGSCAAPARRRRWWPGAQRG